MSPASPTFAPLLLFTLTVVSAFSTPAVNDYQLVATGKVCSQSGRIPLSCGNCGPGWGELADCEDECNALSDCTHITYYEDKGCRIYKACDLNDTTDEAKAAVGTDVYKRNKCVARGLKPKNLLLPTWNDGYAFRVWLWQPEGRDEVRGSLRHPRFGRRSLRGGAQCG